MSSVVSTKCWLCPETYEKKKDMKSHAISEHSVCRVVCPWCVDSERTFGRMSELTKHSKRKHNDLTIDLLEGDFFTEPNGFWLAKRPDDYIRIIKPSEWTSTIAIKTRVALLGWMEATKKEGSDKHKKSWEEGWKKALGHITIEHANKECRNRENRNQELAALEAATDDSHPAKRMDVCIESEGEGTSPSRRKRKVCKESDEEEVLEEKRTRRTVIIDSD
ncbi:unnamed protein product [Mytilus edulis]|uniref:C2H2-type domain-containing protein n=1 Tax=Mytilus edulis TaxID=6550 RepID=A0A8S3QYM1_MYTED|nr:unnamed protein product [Mytilus edulis]